MSITAIPINLGFIVSFPLSTEPDVVGYKIHALPTSMCGGTGTFTPTDAPLTYVGGVYSGNLIYQGPNNIFTHTIYGAVGRGEWLVQVAAYDVFSSEPSELVYSSPISVTPLLDPSEILLLLTGSLNESQLAGDLLTKIESGGIDLTNEQTIKVGADGVIAGIGAIVYKAWSELTPYGIGVIVEASNGKFYKSLLASTNVEPSTQPTYWKEVPNGVKSEVIIAADKFAIINPDDIGAGFKTPFVVGEVNGVSTIGIDGDLVVDGSISALSIRTDELVVGDNITMGPNAVISWNSVEDTTGTKPADNATANIYQGTWTASGKAYKIGDEVSDGGCTWGCILPHVSSELNAPPMYPSTENTWWSLRSAKGDIGETPTVYTIAVESTNGSVFRVGQTKTTTLIAHVFDNGIEVTNALPESMFRWRRVSYNDNPTGDVAWNVLYASGYKQIDVTIDSVDSLATFHCDIIS